MTDLRRLAVLGALALSCAPLAMSQADYSQYVNPFIGSEGPMPGQASGGGDIFVGGARPFGVVKAGIDTTAANLSIATLNGGYTPDGNVTAVSMMHESGTGGASKYGIISQMPLTSVSEPVNVLDNNTYSQPRVGNDTGSVGYFKTQLMSGVTLEVSAARHAGIMQYTFPQGEKHVLVDVSHILASGLGGVGDQFFVGGQIDLQPNGSLYTGYGTYTGGWNVGAPYTVYFCGEFENAPNDTQTFTGANTQGSNQWQTLSNGGAQQPVFDTSRTASAGPLNNRIGAVFSWNETTPSQVVSKIGVSFISADKACSYKDSELPSWVLNDTVDAAVQEWNQDVFSKIQVPVDESANQTELDIFYSNMYFTHLMPSDRTGENPLWESDEPYWDDFYTLWDIFRCTTSLYQLIQPENLQSMIRSLIEIYKYQGYMPDGRSGNWNGMVQGGSDADNVLADAYVKGMRGSINWTEGYAAMKKDAEVLPYNTENPTDLTASVKEGRGALTDWLDLGYVSQDRNTRCISRTVEYSLNDFSLSQVAAGEMPADVQTYLKRSANWQNSWLANVTSLGYTGFLTPRFSDGSWNASGYDPLMCGECEWQAISYEGVPWEYSFTVPFDMETLISFMGGNATFENRLTTAFQPGLATQNLGVNGAGVTTIVNIGNEPDFATPYLYNYINKQYKSVNQSRILANQYFHDANYGIPGNSDAGAMNSWMVWQMVGLYPIVTQPIYLIEAPWFSDINMTVNTNKTLHITATGLDNAGSYFVQSVKLNGQAWTKNWFSHDDLMVNGGTLEFEMGSQPTQWETGVSPPSPGHQAPNATMGTGTNVTRRATAPRRRLSL